MPKTSKLAILLLLGLIGLSLTAYPHSTRHHFIDSGKNLVNTVVAPLKGLFIKGPERAKKAYQYEAHEREKPEKHGQLRNKLFGLWRAPGEQTKGTLDGITEGFTSFTTALKEFFSVFFSD
jgi:hypothetical protein